MNEQTKAETFKCAGCGDTLPMSLLKMDDGNGPMCLYCVQELVFVLSRCERGACKHDGCIH